MKKLLTLIAVIMFLVSCNSGRTDGNPPKNDSAVKDTTIKINK
jgi:hypothetical protein